MINSQLKFMGHDIDDERYYRVNNKTITTKKTRYGGCSYLV